ncbi:Peptidoglycan/xylan/chitin deacetylase, PgdA/CDA1 family [Arthrobacter alpinus]|uniref:Peptidoglycan/xylan/chitin deacetylase, PgdA/CDA1 family n=1 Tax=Arthrobacter alpinus TaxID=656366 RepID=A0A1H5N7D9_9MICC|nr:polysaccharide deacetylase family protein [Arthrobacter alpinus]SEE97456.1 Peptidoglycan/xylan/chitin deacetylase, PgdA/CDA1 family [Arthrobacter alpinus]
MPRHISHSRNESRRIGLVILALVVALVVAGMWWVVSTTAADTSAPTQTSASSISIAAETTVPPTTMRPTTAVTNLATGRVDTLDGLVPDYVLPPIVDGLAPVLTKIPTEQKVVFLTIDDGALKRDSDLELLEENGIKASIFLAHKFIAGDSQFYKKYTAAGHLIENHTMTHNLGFIQLSYEQQKAEICGMADFAEQQYGRRPVFFRPPGGPYTQVTRQAVADCGLKAIVDWEAKANAGGMDYQVGAGLRPGDIVLMHFRPEFPDDLGAFLKAQQAAGLKVVLLEDYLATN